MTKYNEVIIIDNNKERKMTYFEMIETAEDIIKKTNGRLVPFIDGDLKEIRWEFA